MEGNYTIKGYIPPVPDEQNTANNRYEDGNVWLKIPEHPEIRIPPLTLLGWILIGTILVAAIMASLFLLLLLARLRRRRRRKPKSHLFTVVAHPHV
jgi:hypothetical protein